MPTPLEGEEAFDKHISVLLEKIYLLKLHYGIDPFDPGSSFALALALAKQHVPGFKPSPPKRGVSP